MKPSRYRVTPDDRLANLVIKLCSHLVEPLVVDATFEALPLLKKPLDLGGPVVVGVVDVLNDGLSHVQTVRVRDVMHEQEQVIRTQVDGFVLLAERWRILADKSGSGFHCSIHAHAFVVGAMPLSPPVSLGRFNRHAIVVANDVGQRLQSERTRIPLVSRPRVQLNPRDGSDHLRIISKRQPRPFIDDLRRRQIGVPRQTSEPIKIGLRQVITVPVGVQADVRYADKSAGRPTEGAARNNRLHWGRASAPDVHVEIECLLPHWRQEDGVPRLAKVFLGDLKLDRLVGSLERAEKR